MTFLIATYTPLYPAATPTFSPVAGGYVGAQTVSISCSTGGSSIYYTTDGSTPTFPITGTTLHYSTAITVSVAETVKAIATASGNTQSAVGSSAYTFPQTATPTFSPVAGAYLAAQTVSISCSTGGSSIYYTTDGSTPTFPITGTTTLYSTAVSVSTNETVKAIATASGFSQSAVGSAAYTFPQAATPTFSPVAGTYAAAQTVSISCSTGGSSIYYTTDGSTPTFPITGTTVHYTTAITVSASETVKAIATASGFAQSLVGSAAYSITAALTFPITFASQIDFSQTVGLRYIDASWQANVAKYDFVIVNAFGGIEGDQGASFASIFTSIRGYATGLGKTIKCGFYQIDQEWIYPCLLSPSVCVSGGFYKIETVGSTNWNAIGYSGTPTVGGSFTATGAGSGTGVVSAQNLNDTVKARALVNNVGWAVQKTGYPSGAFQTSDSLTFVYANESTLCPSYNITTVGTLAGPGTVNWSQYCAWYEWQTLTQGHWSALENGSPYAGGGFAVNSGVDIIVHDNQFIYPRSSGCWASNSTVYPQSSSFGGGAGANPISGPLQAGHAQSMAKWRALQPGILCGGNVDNFNYYGNGTNPVNIDSSNLGLFDIVLSEAPIGQPFSFATYCGSFSTLITALVNSQEPVRSATGFCLWDLEGANASRQWTFLQAGNMTAADWQAARYQTGIACMLRWAIGMSSNYNDVWWFDEWDAGTGSFHWLGTPVGSRSFTPNAQGIIVIPYTGGTLYLYPAGNNDSVSGLSPVTLTSGALVGGGGHHINYNGFSDSSINTGLAFSSLTISPRDCIFTKP